MEVVLLYPTSLLLLVTVPLLCAVHRKFVRQSSVVIPDTRLLKKIIGIGSTKKSKNIPLLLRSVEIFLLVVSCAEPMVITDECVIRASQYFILCSLICFTVEILLRSTIFRKLP
jgi:hypothetical protein